MAEFVRICPKCKQVNAEYENVCSACSQFIGMEATVIAPVEKNEEADVAETSAAINSAKDSGKAAHATLGPTQRYIPASSFFYLEVKGLSKVYTVHTGSVIGQAHESSRAQVQISPQEVQGADFIHRSHLRCECVHDKWSVICLDQNEFGREFTNPSFINQQRLPPGERHIIQNGDSLALAGVVFNVRMV